MKHFVCFSSLLFNCSIDTVYTLCICFKLSSVCENPLLFFFQSMYSVNDDVFAAYSGYRHV